jgi:hypothetical protein
VLAAIGATQEHIKHDQSLELLVRSKSSVDSVAQLRRQVAPRINRIVHECSVPASGPGQFLATASAHGGRSARCRSTTTVHESTTPVCSRVQPGGQDCGMEFFCFHRDRPGSLALRHALLEEHCHTWTATRHRS